MHRLRNAFKSVRTVFSMLQLMWRAAPVYLVALLLLELVQGTVSIATAWVTKMVFDLLAQEGQQEVTLTLPQELLLLLGAYALLFVVSQLIVPINTFLNAVSGRRLTLHVQSTIYQKINTMVGLAPFEDPRFHNTIQLATQGAQFGPSQSLYVLTLLAQSATILVGFWGILLALNPLLAGIVSLAVLPQLYAQVRIGRQRFGVSFENSPKQRRATYYGMVLLGVQFAKEVRLFNVAGYFLGAFRRTIQDIHKVQHNQQVRELRWQGGLTLLTSVVSSGAFVFVVLQAAAGRLSLGDVALYTSAVVRVQSALSSIILALADLHEGVLFYNSYAALLELAQPLIVAKSARPVPPLKEGIELRNISFRYSSDHPWVLRNVNLSISAGQCVALVGLNGAGKTTLVKLLTRLYDPTEGQILWDGTDIRAFDPTELRDHIATILQDFVRYELTVHQNIGLGNVTCIEDMTRIQQAATHAGIQHTVEGLAQGYQTMLSRWLAEDSPGIDLSGGEWQKVALARMFMRDADLLILDEPTAALDAQAEYDVYNRFAELVHGRTSLLITHRFSTVQMAHVIAVIEHGHLTEYGNHEELLLLRGTYAKLYNMQAERYR